MSAIQVAQDRLDQLSACWRALADLMIPEADAAVLNRGDLAMLIGFLADEDRKAREALREALRG